MKTCLLATVSLLAMTLLPSFSDAAPAELERCNVVWDSPSADARGSMPIGNGDIGINAWVEASGDLVFYISKTDAWDESGRLCKIGRVCVTFDPPLPVAAGFGQKLQSEKPRLVWYHRNTRSEYELGLRVQRLEALRDRFPDLAGIEPNDPDADRHIRQFFALAEQYQLALFGGSDHRLRNGETYRGSLWVKGRAGRGLIIRLLDGEKELDVATLAPVSAQWRELAFPLRPKNDARNATLRVGLPEGNVCLDQVSLVPDAARQTGGFRPDLLQAIADLRPPVIRWPGGCFASAYRWKQGVGPQHKRRVHPRFIWDQHDVYSLGTDEFAALCRKVGAQPLIVVNIGTPQWVGQGREAEFEQEVADWIEYCNGAPNSPWGRRRAENGHPEPYAIKYWEIDNETWEMGVENYAAAVRRVAAVMKKTGRSNGWQDGSCGRFSQPPRFSRAQNRCW